VISKYLISRIEENMVIFGSKYIDLGWKKTHNFGLQDNCLFFAENWVVISKFLITTLTPGSNPRLVQIANQVRFH
jgi:hypothetical protein